MNNRKRNIQMKFYVDEDELELINQRYHMADMTNRGAYIRKMAIDGFIISVDTSDLKQLIKEVNAIGQNINQIARKVNAENYIDSRDMSFVKLRVEEIWQLLKSTLSSTLSAKQ